MAPRVRGSTEVVGKKVRNFRGDDLGKVDEVMLDLVDGRIAYAVLSYGGALGLGTTYYAIPWENFIKDPEEDYWILDMSKEELNNSPGVSSRKELPMTEDVVWDLEEIRRRQEIRPEHPSEEETHVPVKRTAYVPVQRTEFVPVEKEEYVPAEKAKKEKEMEEEKKRRMAEER
jgi:sporulation protein YlmC with PRC-barrel domain